MTANPRLHSATRGVAMTRLLCCLALLSCAVGADAYQLLLDIDLDNDPTTVNEITWDTETLVDLILAPDAPGEVVGHVEFGLGGSCRNCNEVHEYGTDFDLADWVTFHWVQAAGWDSGYAGITLLGCPGEIGYHVSFWCEPLAGTVVLDAPFVLAEFTARVAAPVLPGCSQPASNLICFHGLGYDNYIQIGGPALGNDTGSWGTIKSLYR